MTKIIHSTKLTHGQTLSSRSYHRGMSFLAQRMEKTTFSLNG